VIFFSSPTAGVPLARSDVGRERYQLLSILFAVAGRTPVFDADIFALPPAEARQSLAKRHDAEASKISVFLLSI
jgi:hypothetical protein